MTDKEKVLFENGGQECRPADPHLSADYIQGYRKGQEDAFKWRSPETLPKQDGAEAILWLTTDKGFEDVSVHSYLKDGSWYWADSDDIIKRQDFIMGWLPWPGPPGK